MVDHKKIKRAPRQGISLFWKVVLIYYSLVGIIVFLSLRSGQPLGAPISADTPVSWRNVVQFLYYVLPVLLALFYGLVFRPFWSRFRDLLVVIITINGLYSVGLFVAREIYFDALKLESEKARLADYTIYKVQHRMLDKNKDGLIDQVEFTANLDAGAFPPGEYAIYAKVTQKGQEFPDSLIGEYPFKVLDVKQQPFIINFSVDPQLFEPYYASGDFDLDVGLKRRIGVTAFGKRLLEFSRWSPFIRFGGWDGEDDDIRNISLDLDNRSGLDTFYIMPIKLLPLPVKLAGTRTDYVVDANGNGLYDELVLTIPLSSEYEGPVFIQTIMRGAEYPLTFEGKLALGDNMLEVTVDHDYIQDAGEEGPFEFLDFQIFSRNPACQEGDCARRIKPDFVFYLENYLTQRYDLNQFDKKPGPSE